MTGKILIVDDEPDVLEVLNANLTREGYTVRTASNGQQAEEHGSAEPVQGAGQWLE